MKISLLTLLLLAAIVACIDKDVVPVSPSDALECPASHFDLLGRYTLGKQDELNRTFGYLQDRISQIGSITYNSTPSTQYTIYNTRPTFFYRDSKQVADILGNDTIVIYGGKLEVDITFNWTKTTSVITRNGTGSCFGLSDMISFAKTLIIQNGSTFSYALLDWQNVTWSDGSGQPFNINRISPPDATSDDQETLHKMLNNLMGYETIRNQLQQEIDKKYSYFLSNCLHDEHHHIDTQFDYIWAPGGGPQVVISMMRRPIMIDIEKDGIRSSFDVQAEMASKWTCGDRMVPHLPLNPTDFGSLQEFVGYDFYENMLRYAIEKNLFDTDLGGYSWQSHMFQFYAGDLYQIFPLLQQKYYASESINGNCKATYTGLKVQKSTHTSFNVSIHFDCQLNVRKQKFIDFSLGLTLEVEGRPSSNAWQFNLLRHDQFASFYPYGDYKMEKKELAELMISHSLNRLYEINLFGSGYPMSPPRDYPHMIAEANYTVIYDSSHFNEVEDGEGMEYLDLALQE